MREKLLYYIVTWVFMVFNEHVLRLSQKDTNSEELTIFFICGAFGRGDKRHR